MTHIGNTHRIYRDLVEQAGYSGGHVEHIYAIVAGAGEYKASIEVDDGDDEESEESSEMTIEEFVLLEKFGIHPLKDYQ